ncbi:unnamed protein product [Paramecium pentaurelia]|uniref:Uncharacterized protein n=1 Tax=Paramecium pentaurelia TaxID=43138 RepID=A0A8S1S8M7_9CILI|nr:unnamed protein product [Paramecium pentaurelia]
MQILYVIQPTHTVFLLIYCDYYIPVIKGAELHHNLIVIKLRLYTAEKLIKNLVPIQNIIFFDSKKRLSNEYSYLIERSSREYPFKLKYCLYSGRSRFGYATSNSAYKIIQIQQQHNLQLKPTNNINQFK